VYWPPTKPAGYGIDEPFPRRYLAQQLHMFLPRPAAPAPAAVPPSSSPSVTPVAS